MLIRIRYKKSGQHTHVRIYAGPGTLTLGFNGELIFRNEEWKTLKEVIDKGQILGGPIEVLEDNYEKPNQFR